MSLLSARDRVFILAPHPDDESFATGGLIQRVRAAGADLRVVFASNGENNPWPQRFLERRWRVSEADRQRWGERRREEARAALETLGAARGSARFLDLPDQGMTRLLMTDPKKAVAPLARELAAWQPTLLAGPSRDDAHPDHSALHILLRLAARESGAENVRRWDFVVHPTRFSSGEKRVTLSLSEGELRRKLAAIYCHETQMALSGKRFAAFAQPREFYETQPRAKQGTHPICSARLEHGTLRLVVRAPGLRLPGQRLLLTAETDLRGALRCVIPLSIRSGAVHAKDERNGQTEFEGFVRHARGEIEIQLPFSSWGDASFVFAKIIGPRLRFFERAGWRELPSVGMAQPDANRAQFAGKTPDPCLAER